MYQSNDKPFNEILNEINNLSLKCVESFDKDINENCDNIIYNKIIIICGSFSMDIKLDILVGQATNNPYLYYRIKCNKITENNFISHPFRKLPIDCITSLKSGEVEIGEVIADNELVRKMFEYLMMDDEELQKYIGSALPISYRSTLINTIFQLWD